MEDIRVLLFLHIVESLLLAAVGLRLFDQRVTYGKLLLIGVIHGLIVWLVRGFYKYYGIALGSHTVVVAIFLFLLLKLLAEVSWSIALGATLVSFCLVSFGGMIPGVIIKYFDLNIQVIFSNPWWHVLVGLTETSFLILALLLNIVFGIKVTGTSEILE